MPVKSFIELAAIASDLERKDWSSQDVEVLEEKVKREQRATEARKKERGRKGEERVLTDQPRLKLTMFFKSLRIREYKDNETR